MAADGKVRLLFVNSMTERKGPDHLVAALALLPAAVRERLRVTMVGDGPLRERLEAQARAAGLDIRFPGAKPYGELGQWYGDADVLAIPSLADYRSLAGFEGLAYGLALIASRHDGATRETVIEGETGFAIEPTDHAGIAAAITRLVEDPALLARFRAGAAALYAERFSVERIAANLAESVELALART